MITWHGADWKSRVLVSYLRGIDHPAKLRLVKSLMSVLYPAGVPVKNTVGAKLCVCPSDFIAKQILWDGQYEGESLDLAARLLKEKGGTFVDVGANVGLYTCTLGVLPNVNCIAVEPHAKNFMALENNVAYNTPMKARLFNLCLDREQRFVELDDFNPVNSGMVRVVFNDRAPNSTISTVAAITLDNLFELVNNPSVTLLKVDVEGYELRVLEGFSWESHSRPQHVLIEYSDYVSRVTHEGKESILRFFEMHGYEGLTIRGEPLAQAQSIPESNAWFRDRRPR
jgi:FkbM family methyltransferase